MKKARIRVLVSFGNLQIGDTADLMMNPCVQGWANAGLVEVTEYGAYPARQSGPEQDDDERDPVRAEGGESAGGAASEGFGSGSYGSPS